MNIISAMDDDNNGDWLVLVNTDGQHALWPVCRPVPAGWNEVGPEGSRDACLAFVEANWVDLRPASAR